MKQLTLFFLLLISLISCNSPAGNQVNFYNGLQLSLLSSEKLVNLDQFPAAQPRYAAYFKNSDFNIPLNKHYKHPKYTLYIGIPLGVSIAELDAKALFPAHTLLESITEKDNYTFKRYKNPDGLFVTEYARQHNNNSIYILAITSDSETSEKLLNWGTWENKLKLKN